MGTGHRTLSHPRLPAVAYIVTDNAQGEPADGQASSRSIRISELTTMLTVATLMPWDSTLVVMHILTRSLEV